MHVSAWSVFFLKFCLASAGRYDICVINVGMNIGKVKLRKTFS